MSGFVNGASLQQGRSYRCISTGEGVIVDNNVRYLATDSFDKKGNRMLVSTADGSVAYASSTSVWSAMN